MGGGYDPGGEVMKTGPFDPLRAGRRGSVRIHPVAIQRPDLAIPKSCATLTVEAVTCDRASNRCGMEKEVISTVSYAVDAGSTPAPATYRGQFV